MNSFHTLLIILCIPLTTLLPLAAAGTEAQSDQAIRDERMAWFRDARFGLFLHWGLYSIPAGEWKGQQIDEGSEWIQQRIPIPGTEYETLKAEWNPGQFDPARWAELAHRAGMRYVVLTSKHHDGFCLWPSAFNEDWDVEVTPYRKDLIGPFTEAFREAGLTVGLYHSILDWRHPDWPARPDFNDHGWPAPQKERYKQEVFFPQIRELVETYSPSLLWFDGGWDGEWTSEDGLELETLVRELDPMIVMNNRSGWVPEQPDFGFEMENTYSFIQAGDYISPERIIPPTGIPGVDWETCQTIQAPNNWGYNAHIGFKPFDQLLMELVDIASKGGNYLLNVGPRADGSFPPGAVALLEQFGEWMALNGEAIHGTTASPFATLPFEGRCTRKGHTLYFHVFEWPTTGTLSLPAGLDATSVHLLTAEGPVPLACSSTKDVAPTVTLPPEPPHPLISVLAVEFTGTLGN